jgi:hypothetical protein
MTGRETLMTDAVLDAVLAEWLGTGSDTAPDRIAENAMVEIATTPQEGTRWSSYWVSMTSAPVVWAAVVILGVAVGLAILIGPRLVGPSPTPLPSPNTSPTASPGPSATHQSDTPVGRIDWVQTESDRRVLPTSPYGGQILGWEPTADFEIAGIYVSDDGIAWLPTEAPPWGLSTEFLNPDNPTQVVYSPDGYGTSMGPASSRQIIYRDWTDNPGDPVIYQLEGERWVPFALPPTAPPPIEGLRIYSSRIQGAAALDESNWVAPVMHFVEVPWADILGVDLTDAWPMWNDQTQQLEIHAPGGDPFANAGFRRLTVGLAARDPQVIEFRDAETGELVHQVPATLPGWTPEALVTALRGWGLLDYSFVVSHDGEITVVRPPWTMGEDWTDERIVTAFGRYYTTSLPLGEGYSSTDIHLWESEDGLVWTLLDVPQLWTDTLEWAELVSSGEQLIMIPHDLAGGSPLWVSTDARNWTPAVLEGQASVFSPISTDFGWLAGGFDQTAVSADGLNWQWIDLPDLPAEPSVIYINGLFLYGPEQVGDQWVTWIGQIAD